MMTIPEILAKGGDYSAQELELLKTQVGMLQKKESSQDEILSARSAPPVAPDALETFFRKNERSEKVSQIIQYLLEFLAHIPESSENEARMFNPIAQFRECVAYELELLLERDVCLAVFDRVNRIGSINGENVWDFQGKIFEKYRELNFLLKDSGLRAIDVCHACCLILEQLCLFWFDVRQRDINQIRRTDVYLYQLARILRGRCRQTPES